MRSPVVRPSLRLRRRHVLASALALARVFIEALQRAGKDPSRSAFIDATWSLKKIDLGGFQINANPSMRSASRFVELTMVGRHGRFMR